eukprot:14301313-Alexandrium_andersonii.AAC.1
MHVLNLGRSIRGPLPRALVPDLHLAGGDLPDQPNVYSDGSIRHPLSHLAFGGAAVWLTADGWGELARHPDAAVSYTHLTLPTICSV